MRKILTSKGVLDINIPANPVTGADGEYYMICPICTFSRQPQHQKERKFAVNLGKHPSPWRCNHCNEAGYVLDDNYLSTLKIKPILQRIIWNDLSDVVIEYFKKRKISKETLQHFNIKETLEPMFQQKHTDPSKKDRLLTTKTVNFPYIRNGMLINIKYRDARKNFKLIKGGSKIFYNIDSLENSKFGVIVEGEIDVLSYYEAGIIPVVSVPNGAQISDKEREHFVKTGEITMTKEYNLEYLDNCIDDFEHLETIYIATDDDPAGIKLREQIARRLGKSRCKYILFSKYKKDNGDPCNDPNNVLVHHGAYILKETLQGAISYPLENVTTALDYLDEIKHDYFEGRSKGLHTGWISLDPHFNWMRGWTYLVNGFPGEGKSSAMFNLILASTLMYKWPCGMYLPENYPEKNVINTMAEILVGNTVDPKYNSRMKWDELERSAKNHISKYIYFLNHDKGFSPEDLREKKELLVKKHGIVVFFTDPWLALNHKMRPKFGSIDEYINYELNFEIRQSQSLNIINIIAHHPSTPIRNKEKEYSAPSAFEPIGGQIWYNKVFGMICIHRSNSEDLGNTFTEFHVQKQKEEKLAGIRTRRDDPVMLRFDRRSNRFYEKENLNDAKSDYTRCPFDDYDMTVEDKIDMDF